MAKTSDFLTEPRTFSEGEIQQMEEALKADIALAPLTPFGVDGIQLHQLIGVARLVNRWNTERVQFYHQQFPFWVINNTQHPDVYQTYPPPRKFLVTLETRTVPGWPTWVESPLGACPELKRPTPEKPVGVVVDIIGEAGWSMPGVYCASDKDTAPAGYGVTYNGKQLVRVADTRTLCGVLRLYKVIGD